MRAPVLTLPATELRSGTSIGSEGAGPTLPFPSAATSPPSGFGGGLSPPERGLLPLRADCGGGLALAVGIFSALDLKLTSALGAPPVMASAPTPPPLAAIDERRCRSPPPRAEALPPSALAVASPLTAPPFAAASTLADAATLLAAASAFASALALAASPVVFEFVLVGGVAIALVGGGGSPLPVVTPLIVCPVTARTPRPSGDSRSSKRKPAPALALAATSLRTSRSVYLPGE